MHHTEFNPFIERADLVVATLDGCQTFPQFIHKFCVGSFSFDGLDRSDSSARAETGPENCDKSLHARTPQDDPTVHSLHFGGPQSHIR